MLLPIDDDLTAHEDVGYARRILKRILVRGPILHGLRIEDHDVRGEADL